MQKMFASVPNISYLNISFTSNRQRQTSRRWWIPKPQALHQCKFIRTAWKTAAHLPTQPAREPHTSHFHSGEILPRELGISHVPLPNLAHRAKGVDTTAREAVEDLYQQQPQEGNSFQRCSSGCSAWVSSPWAPRHQFTSLVYQTWQLYTIKVSPLSKMHNPQCPTDHHKLLRLWQKVRETLLPKDGPAPLPRLRWNRTC